MKIIVMNSVTLDGVMQSPGRADEDQRGGFQYGGWAVPGSDETMTQAMHERMANGAGWLLGRRSYEEMLGYWNSVPDNPFAAALNSAPKYVVSTTLEDPLPWPNTTVLRSAVDEIRTLKTELDGDLGVMGSGALIGTLLPHKLIDEFLLMIHPVVLGSGRRLFPEGTAPTPLRLLNAETSATGVVIARYEPADGHE